MRRSILLIVVLLSISFAGCKGQESNPYADAEPIHIQRFDKDLFQLIMTDDSTLQGPLMRNYYGMLDVIGKGVLNLQSPETEGYFDQLVNYFSEPTLKGLYKDAITLYDTIAPIEKQLGVGVAYLKAQFPSMPVPVVYMHVSGLNQNVLVAENLLSISIDKYMGKRYPLYLDFFHEFQLEEMQAFRIVPDYLTGWLLSEYPFAGKENVLLERMVYEGKIKYLVSHALPDMKPNELMGYSEKDYEWCKANEGTIWKAIVERKHLYTPDHITTNQYFEIMPSHFLASDAPGKLGVWVGWQIVEKYMEETKSTPEALMKETDAQKILTDSKYKPF